MDVTKMADAVFESVRGYMVKKLEPLVDRIKALEENRPEPGEKGPDGAPGPQGERGEDGAPGETGPVGDRGEKGDPGDVGPPGAEGRPGDVGEKGMDGKDGMPGRDGRDGLPGPQGEKGMDGRHGSDGRDGVDGLGFDDLSMEHDGERGFSLLFSRGDQTKRFDFTLPLVLDRGVFKDCGGYAKGDAVTWGGSLWIAQNETKEKPGTGDGWRLAVKKGRDGKDGGPGAPGEKGERGLPGVNGRDLR